MNKRIFMIVFAFLFLTTLAQAQQGEWVRVNLQTGQEEAVYVEDECDDTCELPAVPPSEEDEYAEDMWLDEDSSWEEANLRTLDLSADEALYSDQNFTQTTIVGRDNRINITGRAQGTSRAAVTLEVSFGEADGGLCSGAMVGPRLVLTAAHCLHNQGKDIRGAAVVASGLKNKPVAYAYDIWYPAQFAKTNHEYYDIGLILLDRPLGNTTGVLGLKVIKNGTYDTLSTLVLGRGGDKPVRSLWKSYGHIRWVYDGFIFTDAPVVGGNSGGPMLVAGGKIAGILTSEIPAITWQQFLQHPFRSILAEILKLLNGTAFYPNVARHIDTWIVDGVKYVNEDIAKQEKEYKKQQQQQKQKKSQKKRKRTYHV